MAYFFTPLPHGPQVQTLLLFALQLGQIIQCNHNFLGWVDNLEVGVALVLEADGVGALGADEGVDAPAADEASNDVDGEGTGGEAEIDDEVLVVVVLAVGAAAEGASLDEGALDAVEEEHALVLEHLAGLEGSEVSAGGVMAGHILSELTSLKVVTLDGGVLDDIADLADGLHEALVQHLDNLGAHFVLCKRGRDNFKAEIDKT